MLETGNPLIPLNRLIQQQLSIRPEKVFVKEVSPLQERKYVEAGPGHWAYDVKIIVEKGVSMLFHILIIDIK